jgi:hypothetical protein
VRQSEGGEGGDPVGVARSRLGVPTSSSADATEAGGNRAERSCGSRGKGRRRQVGQCGGWGPAVEREKKGERGTGGSGFQI